jgi:hypothetical protein
LELLRESEYLAMTTAELAEATGRSPRQIRTAVHALEARGEVVLTHEHLGWAGRGEYGRMVDYDNLYFDDRKAGLEPTKIIKKGEDFKYRDSGRWLEALRDLELIWSGMPIHGLLVWLPDKRADWERREAERRGKIRSQLGKSTK